MNAVDFFGHKNEVLLNKTSFLCSKKSSVPQRYYIIVFRNELPRQCSFSETPMMRKFSHIGKTFSDSMKKRSRLVDKTNDQPVEYAHCERLKHCLVSMYQEFKSWH